MALFLSHQSDVLDGLELTRVVSASKSFTNSEELERTQQASVL